MKMIKQAKGWLARKLGLETEYLSWNEYQDRSAFKKRHTFYGKAMHISKPKILLAIAIVCILTPGTNWIIPLAGKLIKTGVTFRW